MSQQQERVQYRTCDHLKEDGIYCGSPALHGRNYCYYHLNLRGRRLARAQSLRSGQPYRLQLPLVENMRAVQAALHEVMQSLADGAMDAKTAGLMLYGLQQAAANLNNKRWETEGKDLQFTDEGRALEYPHFEEKFGIPKGVDLELEPEAALDQAEQHPEMLSQPKSKTVPPQIARRGLRVRLKHSETWHTDDPNWEPSFEDVKRENRIHAGHHQRRHFEKTSGFARS
jgi:hypothetical protein